MEIFKPLHELTKRIESSSNVTDQEVEATIDEVKNNLTKGFGAKPEKLRAINDRLDNLKNLWKDALTSLKTSTLEQKRQIIAATKNKLSQIEQEAGTQAGPQEANPESAAVLKQNQHRLEAIQAEKEALRQACNNREQANWVKPSANGETTALNIFADLAGSLLDIKGFILEGLDTTEIKEILTYSGINDETNKNELATAIETVAKEYMNKKGDIAGAKEAAKPLINVLYNLKNFYETNKNQPNFPYPSPNIMLRAFSEFTATNFIDAQGNIQQTGLVEFIKLSNATLELFFEKFKAYTGLLQEEKTLNQQSQAAGAAPAARPTTPETFRAGITSAPAETPPEAPAETPPSPTTETPPAAPAETPPAAPAETPPEGLPFSTGDPETDNMLKKFIPYLAMLFPAAVPLLQSLGFKIEIEFLGLNLAERRQAMQMKNAMVKMGLNLETLKPLLYDGKELKRILEHKKSEKGSWEQYLQKYLSQEEQTHLKQATSAPSLTAKQIADMLLPTATDTTNTVPTAAA